MTSAKIKKTFYFLIFWGLLIVSFLFFSTLIVLKANGYQLNWHYWKVIKTGIIVLEGEPRDVNIKVNQKYLINLPLRLANVSPGSYEVTVSKTGYHSWQKSFDVPSGKAAIFNDIILFREDPSVTPAPNLTPQQVVNEYQDRTQSIEIKGNEIFYQGNLVTRFGSQILAAAIYPDNQHFVVQLGNEIRVIDLDGTNNILLFNLAVQEPTAITFRDNGRTIIFLDNGQIEARVIR